MGPARSTHEGEQCARGKFTPPLREARELGLLEDEPAPRVAVLLEAEVVGEVLADVGVVEDVEAGLVVRRLADRRLLDVLARRPAALEDVGQPFSAPLERLELLTDAPGF